MRRHIFSRRFPFLTLIIAWIVFWIAYYLKSLKFSRTGNNNLSTERYHLQKSFFRSLTCVKNNFTLGSYILFLSLSLFQLNNPNVSFLQKYHFQRNDYIVGYIFWTVHIYMKTLDFKSSTFIYGNSLCMYFCVETYGAKKTMNETTIVENEKSRKWECTQIGAFLRIASFLDIRFLVLAVKSS